MDKADTMLKLSVAAIGLFLGSSMAEHSAVNRRVVGSSPTRGAIFKKTLTGVFFVKTE